MRPAIIAALIAGALCLPARAESRHLEVTFLPTGEGPALWLEVSSFAEEGRLIRRAQVAWFHGDEVVARTFDDVVEGAPLLGLYPEAPADVPVEITADGSLLITLPALGDWQARLPAAAPTSRRAPPRAAVPAVAFRESARLLLAAPAPGDVAGGAMVAASLYGTERTLEGRARVLAGRRAPASDNHVVMVSGNDLRTLALPSDRARVPGVFVADARRACDRALPRVVVVAEDPGGLRLLSDRETACLESDLAVAVIAGVQLSPQGEGAVRGLFVSRP